MVKKIGDGLCLLAFSFLVGLFLMSLASAAINVSVGSIDAVESGTSTGTGSGTNYSNSSSLVSQNPMVTFNVTFLNNTDFNFNGTVATVTNINATFYLVTEGIKTWTAIAASNRCALVGTTANYVSCWTNISTGLGNFNISEGRYNITAVLHNNAVGSKNSSNNVTMVIFGPFCHLISDTHDYEKDISKSKGSSQITIGNNVWIASNVKILKGVNIGNNCVIGAGSVVNKDIPDNSMVSGIPARIIRKI